MDDWTELKITVPASRAEEAGDIASMTVPYGIYLEDYSRLEEEAMEIARIDLIDEALLQKDRTVGIVHVYISPEENPAEAVQFLTERYRAAGIGFTLDETVCRREDWENNWKQYFKPVAVGKRLLIRPVWADEYDADGRLVLHLEPGVAFGSGTHETTRLCLEAMEGYVRPDTRMLDVGCGSGILSVAGLLLGAQSVTGVDIDRLAVKTAAANGARNGFTEPRCRMLHGDLVDRVEGVFDLVTANLVADAIVQLSGSVKRFLAPGAIYIVSGIIDTRADEVLACLADEGYAIINRREENGWLCLECRLHE